MATIYLSSTYEDLKEYREVVYKALRKIGDDVIAMEDYVATDKRPVDKCLDDVRKADIYVGVFGFRYGFVPPDSHGNPDKLSITELEFRQAEKLNKPILAFVVNESTPWRADFMDSQKSEDRGERVSCFRKYLLTEKTASSFSAPHELATLVLAAVTKQKEAENRTDQVDKQERESASAVIWDIEKAGPHPTLALCTSRASTPRYSSDVRLRSTRFSTECVYPRAASLSSVAIQE